MVLPRSNKTLLESIFHAADRLEHIAVSYAFDARTFLDRLIETEFKALKTLALTSSCNNTTEDLFINAAEAVKKMHALEILEIWNHEAGQADVFRYETGPIPGSNHLAEHQGPQDLCNCGKELDKSVREWPVWIRYQV
ncbi:hypothetical protein DER46DRAFT_679790 [Fusarium sp. MPI-SDFR-AT-0072]|uniref:DUF6546 domain-containing protein n=1 Tax=Fusarium oxysporum f. sp. rapae TaxID=485398 RepID=A0A8J5NTI6_FUSOX|nr:hypothetical protein Forpe1208_v009345 [Fusarium oxysporum f. sp. rapae]KAH7168445.1 hypothetical protein DER46DRAFT_679790 [Fusarium sp. MPI-SDFR-AT-0072]KAI7762217.1 hypothetical protein LZL87_006612 [Fusarium oxysporum]